MECRVGHHRNRKRHGTHRNGSSLCGARRQRHRSPRPGFHPSDVHGSSGGDALRRRGFSLIEVMVVLALSAVLTLTIARAFVHATEMERAFAISRESEAEAREFEETIRTLIESASLSRSAATLESFFMAGAVSLGGDGITSDSLTFTAVKRPMDAVIGSGLDFETINERFGPPGGIEEVSLSLTPVGNPGERSGLFLRTQMPADSEPSQGGYERLLLEGVQSLRFEFFDGASWVGAWDTTTQTTPRLPAAVKMYYTTSDQQEVERVITVRVPASDATIDNPVTIGGGA
ncbi:MAG: prepilin-type N-terminal cleavage/methylation domain-containing protein [Armatimonadetes bacterium]|nr:prepilin-type N-terminal cleavage/methylation domain-containing protein [Armatimonadota bacterium]